MAWPPKRNNTDGHKRGEHSRDPLTLSTPSASKPPNKRNQYGASDAEQQPGKVKPQPQLHFITANTSESVRQQVLAYTRTHVHM